MKLKNIALITLSACLLSCSQPGGSTKPAETIGFGNREPVTDFPELPFNYRPKNLSEKVFSNNGKVFSPMNFESQNLTLSFDAKEKTVIGKSRILFEIEKSGHPYFQFEGTLLSVRLNGKALENFPVTAPDGVGIQYTALQAVLDAKEVGVLEVEYTLPSDRVSFENGGVGFLTDMTDLSPGEFFERWGPSNFEDDQFAMTLKIQIQNSSTNHQLFANGNATKLGPAEWRISFPAHYTASSFYIHLTNRALNVRNFSITGKEKSIPVTVYSSSEALVTEASSLLPDLFKELEKDYGPYPHNQFIAYMHSGGGGMEYVGATITSMGALDHELFHSWFARGMMPAEGRSGWIDEAMASWRDYGYFQASTLLSRAPTVLAGFSPYRRSTPSNCYKDGRQLIAELDVYFKDFGGMKSLMKTFVERYKYRVVTTEELQSHLETATGTNASPFFRRYLFGIADSPTIGSIAKDFAAQAVDSKHPTPLTEQELKLLR